MIYSRQKSCFYLGRIYIFKERKNKKGETPQLYKQNSQSSIKLLTETTE